MFRLAIIILALGSSGAAARTVTVGPDACPLPADAPLYRPDPAVEAHDLNPARSAADGAVVLFDAPLRAGWARLRLFARLRIDAAPDAAPPTPCGA